MGGLPLAVPGMDCCFIAPESERASSDKGLAVSFPVGDLELLLCQGTSLFCQKESDLILRVSKSSIYSTKPMFTPITEAGEKKLKVFQTDYSVR